MRNVGDRDINERVLISYWVTDKPFGRPEPPALMEVSPLNGLGAESEVQMHIDLSLSAEINSGSFYAVAEVQIEGHSDQSSVEINLNNNIGSVAISVEPCTTSTRYCDVPFDYWAFDEIEWWEEKAISRGCRGGTEVFKNRPFCPEQLVNRGTLAVFLVRLLQGGIYQPSTKYDGFYADISAETPWREWIEDLYRLGFRLESEHCPPTNAGDPQFCWQNTTSRAEFAIYLSQLRSWDLEPVRGDIFADIADDTPANRAIEYMWTHNIIQGNEPPCTLLSSSKPAFCPEVAVTRAWVAALAARAFR